MKSLVCLGTNCMCNQGVNPLPVLGKSIVTSSGNQILLNGSKIVGSFGICKILSQNTGNPTPCSLMIASFENWENTSKTIKINNKEPLLENSSLTCSLGGKITLIPNKSKIQVNK